MSTSVVDVALVPALIRVRDEIDLAMRSRTPYIALLTAEETRALRLVQTVAELPKQLSKPLLGWTRLQGLRQIGGPDLPPERAKNLSDTEDPRLAVDQVTREALRAIESEASGTPEHGAIYVCCDFAPWLDAADPEGRLLLIRQLRELAALLRKTRISVIFLGADFPEIPELRDDIARVALPLPDADETRANLLFNLDRAARSKDRGLRIVDDADTNARLVDALCGLTEAQQRAVFNQMLIREGGNTSGAVVLAFRAKQELISTLEYLELLPAIAPEQYGGYPHVVEYAHDVADRLTTEARSFGIPHPRGVLLMGPPGCGKSVVCQVFSHWLRQSLWDFHLGVLLGAGDGVIGQAARAMRHAIAVFNVTGGVIRLDEFDKTMGGAEGSSRSDGGARAGIMAQFMTWAAGQRSVFLMGTLNDPLRLDPALMREGRWDKIVYIDTPDCADRQAILRVHVGKRGQDPEALDLAGLAAEADRYSGAELEAAVERAHADCFRSRSFAITTDLLRRHLKQTAPLAITRGEELKRQRDWAERTGLLLPEAPSAALRRAAAAEPVVEL